MEPALGLIETKTDFLLGYKSQSHKRLENVNFGQGPGSSSPTLNDGKVYYSSYCQTVDFTNVWSLKGCL